VLKRRGFARPTLLILAVPVAALTLAATALMISSQCSTSAPTATPTSTASKAIPPQLLTIYEQVGSQYNLPWQILAGVDQEECDQGRDPDPSCTPQPGATGPGTANFAGASGPMHLGIGGAAGDEYDSLRRYLPNPSLGPHDPTTAVQLAALVLIKDKGARPGKPLDSYHDYVRAYNGSGPMADAYAAACSPTHSPTAPAQRSRAAHAAPPPTRRSLPARKRKSLPAGTRPPHSRRRWRCGR
jgi:hypothetical protein